MDGLLLCGSIPCLVLVRVDISGVNVIFVPSSFCSSGVKNTQTQLGLSIL